MAQRARGFDVPDFLAAGPRNILVPASAEEKARQLLADLDSRDSSLPGGGLDGADESGPGIPGFDAPPDYPD
jgi:hypothetical protein